jgi:hypothetical protein
MLRRRLSTAALLLAALGCSGDGRSPFGPSELLGATYALTSVNGEPLPFTLWTEASGASATLVGESLVFGAGDRVERRRVLRQTSAQGVTTTEPMTIPQEYRRSGLAIEIGWFEPCPPNALCIGNDVGTLTSAGVRLTSNMYHVGGRPAELRYEAVRER